MSQFTHEEINSILSQSIEATQQGDHAKSSKLIRQLPMPAWLALATKDVFGVEYLEGWDLKEAEATYGGRLRKRKIKHVKPIADARY